MRIDLNCDLGEGFGVYSAGNDELILPYITSANIACGFHAGDPATMRRTVLACLEKGVQIGAHPGLLDRQGFGRREMNISPQEAFDWTVYQVGALQGVAAAEGAVVRHVKPHGALYHMASLSEKIAEAIAEAVYRISPDLMLYGAAGSELIRAGKRAGLRTVNEVFGDRTYRDDGTLTPRSEAGALIANAEAAAEQVCRIMRDKIVVSRSGTIVPMAEAGTVCIHGDGPHAVEFARAIRERLIEERIPILATAIEN